jgi:hypothetical protein
MLRGGETVIVKVQNAMLPLVSNNSMRTVVTPRAKTVLEVGVATIDRIATLSVHLGRGYVMLTALTDVRSKLGLQPSGNVGGSISKTFT